MMNEETYVEELDESMLTTFDNPYNPFTQFIEWFQFDFVSGYHSGGLLARVAPLSSDLSDADQMLIIDEGISTILDNDVLGIYCRIYPDGRKEGPPKDRS